MIITAINTITLNDLQSLDITTPFTLSAGQTVDLFDSYNLNQIQSSTDLTAALTAGDATLALNGVSVLSADLSQLGLGPAPGTALAQELVDGAVAAGISLDTDDVTEASNLYYTDGRADARIAVHVADRHVFEYVSEPSVQSAPSTAELTVATLTTSDLDSGTYEVIYSYGWNVNSTTRDFVSSCYLNSNKLGESHREEPKDSAGSFGSTGTDQKHYLQRRFVQTLSGVNTLDLRIQRTNSSTIASVWEVVISIEKKS